ncbi:30S ribosomal protein S20 [Candidatus Parcubacteria bacterium]|nr:30S ribosomal protein S20 [Candidatus Parcubacteria bacterium]
MPITRSAKKALRTSFRKRDFNRVRKENANAAVKSVKKLAATGKKKEALAAFRTAQKALDKAVKEHTLDKNTASRRKSRLSRLLKTLK